MNRPDDDKPMILAPGLDAAGAYAMQNSPRAKIANRFYTLATGIKNRAGAFVGFALSGGQLEEILHDPNTRGAQMARDFFNRYAQPSGAEDVGRFLLVGIEVDMFLDLLAGLDVKNHYQRPNEKITPHSAAAAEEINKKDEGRRW